MLEGEIMKTKTFKKKLTLNKKTIANLGNETMDRVYAGQIPVAVPVSDYSFCNQETCEECTSLVPIETCGGLSMCVCNEPVKTVDQRA